MFNQSFKWCLILLLTVFMAGCSTITEVKQELELADALSTVAGKVSTKDDVKPSSVRILILKKHGDFELSLINQVSVDDSGNYTFVAPPGEYFVVAYADKNNDFMFQDDAELAGYLGQIEGPPRLVKVSKQSSYQVSTIKVEGLLENSGEYHVSASADSSKVRTGAVVSLDDPMFSRKNARLGMMKPIEFVNTIGGGVFLFEPYDKEKTPVIFIHGIGGSVSDWAPVIQQLDTDKFQAFGVYYASGFRLNLISDYLQKSIVELQKQHGFKQFHVVSHSMGGLVARSFVKKYASEARAADIGLLATVNSPMLGMDSANSGVKYSPIIVPSWRDVASGSDFIDDLMQWDLPSDIQYYLYFTYETGNGDDGVVPLESQLPQKLQDEATRVVGLNGSHASVLSTTQFTRQFNQMLQQHSKSQL